MFLLLLLSEANNIVGLHKTLGSRLTQVGLLISKKALTSVHLQPFTLTFIPPDT